MNVISCGEPLVVLTPVTGRLAEGPPLAMTVGGAEVNVAIHLARMGVAVSFAGAVGDDALGELVVGRLRADGVDTTQVHIDPDRPTGLYFKDPTPTGSVVDYYRAGSAAAAFDCAEVSLDGADWLHVTGVQVAVCGAGQVLALIGRARAAGARTSVDVNLRRPLWDSRAEASADLLEVARSADMVFVGLDEAHELWGVTMAVEVRSLLPEGELVVKDGPRSATAFGGDESATVPPPDATVVELVGAGDAFAAAYLHARLAGAGLEQACLDGHALAAAVIGTLGDNGEADDPVYARLRAEPGLDLAPEQTGRPLSVHPPTLA